MEFVFNMVVFLFSFLTFTVTFPFTLPFWKLCNGG
jgi:hypothetical protein